MREIKFRAWDRKMKKLFPVHEIRLNPNGGNLIEIKGYDDWDSDGWTVHGGTRMMYANEDRYILNQFTGLKDKNGREIYEGDIYSYTMTIDGSHWNEHKVECSNVVKFEDGAFYHGVHLLSDVIEYDETLAYVGNIYENPELLEGDYH